MASLLPACAGEAVLGCPCERCQNRLGKGVTWLSSVQRHLSGCAPNLAGFSLDYPHFQVLAGLVWDMLRRVDDWDVGRILPEADIAAGPLEFWDGCFSSDGKGSAEVAEGGQAAVEDFEANRDPYLDCGGRRKCCGASLPAGMQYVSDLLDQPAAMAPVSAWTCPVRNHEPAAAAVRFDAAGDSL